MSDPASLLIPFCMFGVPVLIIAWVGVGAYRTHVRAARELADIEEERFDREMRGNVVDLGKVREVRRVPPRGAA